MSTPYTLYKIESEKLALPSPGGSITGILYNMVLIAQGIETPSGLMVPPGVIRMPAPFLSGLPVKAGTDANATAAVPTSGL